MYPIVNCVTEQDLNDEKAPSMSLPVLCLVINRLLGSSRVHGSSHMTQTEFRVLAQTCSGSAVDVAIQICTGNYRPWRSLPLEVPAKLRTSVKSGKSGCTTLDTRVTFQG